ncbi:hypothetical protein BST36_25250 [Mycolicibacterium moriokaense]|nr:hypothetical protein BST36_25250 [Mycolicibacterium moriokaense]
MEGSAKFEARLVRQLLLAARSRCAHRSDGSTAFWHADSGTLISGDAVLSAGGQAWFIPETVDNAAATRSEERLRALPVEHLLPGHGLPVHRADVWADAR